MDSFSRQFLQRLAIADIKDTNWLQVYATGYILLEVAAHPAKIMLASNMASIYFVTHMSEELLQAEKPAKRSRRAVVKAGSRGLEFRTMDELWRFCVACANSKEFKDVTTPEQALVRIQAGLELGLTPIWALCNVMVVHGRPAVWGDAMLGLVLRHRDCIDVIEEFEGDTALCTVYRRGRDPVQRMFSTEDAKRAGLLNKGGTWQGYPARMKQMRARAFALRDSFADVLRGLGMIEEVSDYSGPGDVPTSREVDKKRIPDLVLPDEVPAGQTSADPSQKEGEAREGVDSRDGGTNLPPADIPVQEPKSSDPSGGSERPRRKRPVPRRDAHVQAVSTPAQEISSSDQLPF